MIMGSNAIDEVIPPHFQFMTAAQSEEKERIRMEVAAYFNTVHYKFGMIRGQNLGVSLGLNEKGGMDSEEFEKHIKNSILI